MRAGIRQKLLDSIQELKGCYEPSVPTKQTVKPYAVIVQGSDNEDNAPTGFKRTVEIWIYEKKTTFQKLDALMTKVIGALELQTVINPETLQSYTCKFNGTIGQDIIDEEWDAIARGLQFSVIALHESEENTGDLWVEALSHYTEQLASLPVYRDCWRTNFAVPSILWRAISVDKVPINGAVFKIAKTLKCHVVSRNKSQIEQLLDIIENKLVIDLKVPLDIHDKRYLTVESIREDRTADMLGSGQLTVTFSRRQMIENNTPAIEKIYSRGKVE
jgi:hypothetical protein